MTDPTAGGPDSHPVLDVRDLTVAYGNGSPAVRSISFHVQPGEMLGIVGESGSGKTTAALSAIGLPPRGASVIDGSATLRGTDLTRATPRQLRDILGKDVGIIYQDPLRSLNPVMRIGTQVAETFEAHRSGRASRVDVTQVLADVGIPDPSSRLRSYPHEFSGGMRQRAIIGMALALSPSLVVADEPTTAVDVTVQAQILDLLDRLANDQQTAAILVSHDLGVIARMCDRVAVMYAGRIVETGQTEQVFDDPHHPYTRALLAATPDVTRPRRGRLAYITGRPPEPGELPDRCPFEPRCAHAQPECVGTEPDLLVTTTGRRSACVVVQESGVDAIRVDATTAASEGSTPRDRAVGNDVVLQAQQLRRVYPGRGWRRATRRDIVAVDDVSLQVRRGEILGIVGESGCGKSTLGRMLVGLETIDDGDVTFDNRVLSSLSGAALRRWRRRVQMIYQDPRSSLNPSMTVGRLLREPMLQAGVTRRDATTRAADLLTQVGLSPSALARRPHEFSGGQSQRIAIARALAVGAEILVADEAVSSLDVSVKGQVLEVLQELRDDVGLSVVFISHDLSVVREACDRLAVMYLGRIVESGPTDQVFAAPRHPYTQALLSALPIPDPVRERERRHIILPGDPPSPAAPPPGCRFHPRCPIGPAHRPDRDVCITDDPDLREVGQGRVSACHFAEEVSG